METFTGERLRLVYGASGITGIITQAKIKVQPLTEKAAYLVVYPDTGKCLGALQAYTELPLWSATFFNSQQVELNERASQVERLPRGKEVLLLVAPAGKQEIASDVERMAHQYGGEVLPESLAKEEWEERFYPLRLKRLGPSVIPGEVLVPVKQAVSFLAALTEKYPEIAVEGFMCGRDHMAILTYLLGDERQLAFPLKYASSLVILDLARKFGGRPYALGMLLVDEAKTYFGKYYHDVVAYKHNHDPEGILNPGKTLLPGDDPNFSLKAFHSAFRAAQLSKGVLSAVGRLFGGNGNGNGTKENGKSKLPADITWDTYACAQCGYCRPNCTIFNASPWETNSPRCKWNLLQQYLRGEIPMDESLADLLYTCTTCKRCDPVCQVNIPIVHHWLNIRPQLVEKEKLELTGLEAVRENVLKSGNFFGIPNHNRGAWMDPAVTPQETGEIAYWPGCWASYVMINMSQNFTRILHKAGVPFVYLGEKETCCGLYFAAGGYAQDFANQVKRNIELLQERGVKTLLCSCPGCFATFKEQYPAVAEMLNIPMEFEVKHITEFLDELIKQNRIQFKERVKATVTFHDSCHLGRWNGIYEEPRNIIRSIPGIAFVEMEHNRENGLCCGTVAGFNSLDIAGKIGARRVQEAEATGAQYVVTACAGCGSALNATSEAMGTKDQTEGHHRPGLHGHGVAGHRSHPDNCGMHGAIRPTDGSEPRREKGVK